MRISRLHLFGRLGKKTAFPIAHYCANMPSTLVGPTGHLVACNIPFERAVLRQLAKQFPPYADRLNDMADRLWDQLPIFRQHYADYRFARSNLFKAVLPVVGPTMDYAGLDVQNGAQAQVVWEEMIAVGDTAVRERLATQLRAYCEQDTLAMVEIHCALSALG